MNNKSSKLIRKFIQANKMENEDPIITRKKYQNLKKEYKKTIKPKRHQLKEGFKDYIDNLL